MLENDLNSLFFSKVRVNYQQLTNENYYLLPHPLVQKIHLHLQVHLVTCKEIFVIIFKFSIF